MINAVRKETYSGALDGEIRKEPPVSLSPAIFDENVLPRERMALLGALDYLENLDNDWNGYEAKAPSPLAIRMARHFITRLPLNKAHARKIEPDGEGAILLTWETQKERIMLTIDGTMLHLSHERSGRTAEFLNDIPFFDPSDMILPQAILDHLPHA